MNKTQIQMINPVITYINMKELIHRVLAGSFIIKEVQAHHVKTIRQYIVENFEKEEVYLPTIVGHLNHGSFDQWVYGEITVIDGSHRIVACMQLHEMAKRAIKSQDEELARKAEDFLARFHATQLPIQLYQGLTKEERDQLYLDFNSKIG